MISVTYNADFKSPSGYSKAARAHAKALIQAGVDVLIEDKKHDPTTIELDDWWKKEYKERTERKARTPIKIFHHTPDLCSPNPSQINICMVPWETSRIPDSDLAGNPRYNWVKQLNKVNKVWTFSKDAQEAMLRAGVQTSITVMPHPVDLTPCSPNSTTSEEIYDQSKRQISKDVFKFLSIFQWIPRKDPKSLLLAYFSEFTADEPVVLIIKAYHLRVGDLEPIKKAIAVMKTTCRSNKSLPKVLLVPGVMTDDQVAALMSSVDCLVTTSRAEGFALPNHEAMALGVPSIVPKGSSFLDYFNETNGYPVKVWIEPVHGVSNSPWYNSSQNWHRIDIMDLRRRMREAYEDRKTLTQKGLACLQTAQLFAPAVVGTLMKQSLEEVIASRS